MSLVMDPTERARARNLLFFATPALWPIWPFLPLVRRRPGREDECGLLYDAFHVTGRTGASATVYLVNMFQLPPTEADFRALPREVYDTAEDVWIGGWRVD